MFNPYSVSPTDYHPMDQPISLWQIDELFDLSNSELKDEWEACMSHVDNDSIINRVDMKSLQYFSFFTPTPPNQTLSLINLKTKLHRSMRIMTNSASTDKDGRIALISTDGKALQAFDLEKKCKLVGIEADDLKQYTYVSWLDSESIVFVEGNTLCLLKLSDNKSKEIIMEDIPLEFQTNIISITCDHQFYFISCIRSGEYSCLLYRPENKSSRALSNRSLVGLCLLNDSNSIVIATPTEIRLSNKTGSSSTLISYHLPELAYMTHYYKESQLVIFVGYRGHCFILDLSLKTIIAKDNFNTEIVNSFSVQEDSLVIVDKKGKIVQYSINPSFMLYHYRNNYDISLEIMKYWKEKPERRNGRFQLSSLSSLKPLPISLGKYNRDYYESLHGGIHIFHPIISYYFPIMYQCVIRNEFTIDFYEDEQNIIKDFISYLIYGGRDLVIDGENFLKWAFIFDRCWLEFTEMESNIVNLFNKEFEELAPDFGPLLHKLRDYQLRNHNFENGLLQKCINFCVDVLERRGVLLVEPLLPKDLKHSFTLLSLDCCLLNCQDSCDITLVAFGKQIRAHKTILSTFSSMFEVMLDEEGPFKSEITSNQTLVLGVDEQVETETALSSDQCVEREQKGELFESLIKFCYTSAITCSNEEAFPLFEMADQYQLDSLKTQLVYKICDQLTMDTFIEILKWSELFTPVSNGELYGRILSFGKANGKQLLENYSEQLRLHPDFLLRLLKNLFKVDQQL